MTPPVTGAGANARAPVQPSVRKRSPANGGEPTAGHGPKEHRPGKPPKPKPKKPKPDEKPKPEHRR
jgi:hypothetical protein